MRRLQLLSALALSCVLLCVPFAASAFTESVFHFQNGSLDANWQGFGSLKAELGDDGLHVMSFGTGSLVADITNDLLTPAPDAAILTTTSATDIDGKFTWYINGESSYYTLPLTIAAGENVETPILFRNVAPWTAGKITKIGFELPPGASLTIHTLLFGKWNVVEKFAETVLSFWKFDVYKPYSINFVWGPYLATNPIQARYLFQFLPPNGVSGTYVLQGILLAILFVLSLIAIKRYPFPAIRKQRLLEQTFAVLLVFWLLMDIRMGSQFLAWVSHDMKTYTFANPQTRTFRDRGQFYDFATFVAPLVADRKSYVFFADQPWPYLGNIRYLTYPSIPGNNVTTDDTWVIFNRPDISVSSGGVLVSNGEVVSKPGKILGRFNENSFVFRLTPATK